MQDIQYQTGLLNLETIEGNSNASILESMREVAPELATLIVRFVYGHLYARPGLNLQQRQIVTVAALAALGNARPQLKFHIAGALNVGCTPEQIVELMIHLVVYAGFPAGLNGVFTAREVFIECGVKHTAAATTSTQERARFRAGWDALARIDGDAGEQVIAALADIAPDLGRFIVEFGFGDIYTRPGLDLFSRELVTIAALTAMGTAAPQLKVHAHAFLNVGGTAAQLTETVIHVSAYAGFPAAINAMQIVKEALADSAAHLTATAATGADTNTNTNAG